MCECADSSCNCCSNHPVNPVDRKQVTSASDFLKLPFIDIGKIDKDRFSRCQIYLYRHWTNLSFSTLNSNEDSVWYFDQICPCRAWKDSIFLIFASNCFEVLKICWGHLTRCICNKLHCLKLENTSCAVHFQGWIKKTTPALRMALFKIWVLNGSSGGKVMMARYKMVRQFFQLFGIFQKV